MPEADIHLPEAGDGDDDEDRDEEEEFGPRRQPPPEAAGGDRQENGGERADRCLDEERQEEVVPPAGVRNAAHQVGDVSLARVAQSDLEAPGESREPRPRVAGQDDQAGDAGHDERRGAEGQEPRPEGRVSPGRVGA